MRSSSVASLLITIGLIASASATWKPIVGPSSGSFNNKVPFGDSHTYYGNEFLSEYAGLGEDHLIHPSSSVLGSESLPSSFGLTKTAEVSDQCRPQKYALEYEGTLQIDQSLPSLDQFTLCNWMRFTNHSGDHTVFTYSLTGNDREIQSWIANTPEASFISMAVHGQSLYRLNYPFRYGRWHHQCTSWNGKTGEWQVWIRGERVGRGFHNRLVGHVIKPGGSLSCGGPSITGPIADGLHMEVTMFQMYKVALSAGKAHRDHKHHHVHKFVHNGPAPETTPMPPPAAPNALPQNPLLANGQIPNRVRLNLAGLQQPPDPQPPSVPVQLAGNSLQQSVPSTQFVNGQFHGGSRLVAEQLFAAGAGASKPQPTVSFFPSNVGTLQLQPSADFHSHTIFKRDSTKNAKPASKMQDKKTKRDLVQLSNGQTIDDSLLGNADEIEGLAYFGGNEFKEFLNQGSKSGIEDEIKEYDREPAEGEVMAIMNLCSFCDHEPFGGALVLAWKNVKITMHHALQAKAQGGCGQF